MLGLLPGQMLPQLQEKLVRLGSWLPFGPAAKLFTAFTGVTVSKSTARRLTEAAGKAEIGHQEAILQGMMAKPPTVSEPGPKRLLFAADGAMVPLIAGEWAEARTVAIGEVEIEKGQEGQPQPVTHSLSYFSRLMEATAFQEAALVETQRRGLTQATAVATVSDGALWIQEFVDYHRPDATRIIDFPHAAERLGTVYQACREKGVELGEEWPSQQRQRLRDEGAGPVLETLQALQVAHPQVGLDEPLNYLLKREAMLQYPQFKEQGWPIGSGVVESANKLVVEARLKGAGMHWHREQVNPMLALRNVVCNDCWEESWPLIADQLRKQRQRQPASNVEPLTPEPTLVNDYFQEMQQMHQAWEAEHKATTQAEPKSRRPPANHPWRQSYKRPGAKK